MVPKQPESPSASGKAPPSLHDVAGLAGVSVATASRVLSGSSHPVSDKTRAKVLAAAESLSFVPNRLARALVTARSQTVGVIVHDISDPYFGDIVKGLEDGIHADDYRLFVASSDRDPDKELNYVRAFDAYQVDAIVFAASSFTDPDYIAELQRLAARFQGRGGVIVQLSDHFLEGPRVRFDNRRSAADMVGYLAGRGHTRIGYISGPPDLAVSRVRLAGFEAAVAELGLSAGPEYVVDGRFNVEGGREAIARLLEQVDVTAVLAANDLMAIGATRQLLSAGRAVPDEISVAGIDDIAIAEYGPVPLTTMRIPTYQVGMQGASLLLEALGGGDPGDARLEGEIVERESVADFRPD
ncbi:MAG: LacI family DNA-binding transcriptional regulator [Acidimicrobiia bacterium]